MRRVKALPAMIAVVLSCAGAAIASAQTRGDTTVAPTKPTVVAPKATAASTALARLSPPLSPSKAFLYSAMLPGFGQSRLDRGTSGALFASIELAALTMVRRSGADLREARRYSGDTLPSDFTVSATGVTPSTTPFVSRYSSDLVRTRQLHVEDWLAVLAFNHLFAGADAFVAAQLWDVPVSLSALPRPNGAIFVATLRW